MTGQDPGYLQLLQISPTVVFVRLLDRRPSWLVLDLQSEGGADQETADLPSTPPPPPPNWVIIISHNDSTAP